MKAQGRVLAGLAGRSMQFMGSSHAANVACIQSYKEGIMRTVELMVPGPWFPEAVKMLIETALRHVPRITHLDCHMGCSSLDPTLAALENKLAREYRLDLNLEVAGVKHFRGWMNVRTAEDGRSIQGG